MVQTIDADMKKGAKSIVHLKLHSNEIWKKYSSRFFRVRFLNTYILHWHKLQNVELSLYWNEFSTLTGFAVFSFECLDRLKYILTWPSFSNMYGLQTIYFIQNKQFSRKTNWTVHIFLHSYTFTLFWYKMSD